MRNVRCSCALFLILLLSPAYCLSETYIIDGGGGGNFLTITEGLTAAAAGDTLEVLPGIYDENIEIDLPVSILSTAGSPGTTIRGLSSSDAVVEVAVNGAELIGFTLLDGEIGLSLNASLTDFTGRLVDAARSAA